MAILPPIFGRKIGPGRYRWLGMDFNVGSAVVRRFERRRLVVGKLERWRLVVRQQRRRLLRRRRIVGRRRILGELVTGWRAP